MSMMNDGRWLPGTPGLVEYREPSGAPVAQPELESAALAALADLAERGGLRTCVAPGEPEHDHEMCNDVAAERAQLQARHHATGYTTGYRDGRFDALADTLRSLTAGTHRTPAALADWLRARMDELGQRE